MDRRVAQVAGRRRARAAGLLVLVALAGCASDRAYQAPGFPFAAGWRGERAGSPVLLSNAEWWRSFKDPTLDALVSKALGDNLTIAAAKERIVGARAAYRTIPGAVGISSSASISGQGVDGSDLSGSGDATFGLSWLLDPWGGKRATRRAATARVEQAEAERDAAQLLVLSELSEKYLDLRYRQRLLALRQSELSGRGQTLSLMRKMQEENAATRLDVTRAQARVAELEAELPTLRAQIEGRKNELAVLAGSVPGALGIDLDPSGQPRPRVSPEVGIPADLLRNRPDIRVAERSYFEALAQMDAQQAELYPSLSLSGTISVTALEGGASATQYALGPALTLPVVPSGAGKAAVEVRASEARQAHTIWSQTVLSAILEVENALLDYRAVSTSLGSAERAVTLYRDARKLTQSVFDAGDATLSDLIDADTEVSRAENALAEARFSQALSYVALNIRLGAGHASSAGRGTVAGTN